MNSQNILHEIRVCASRRSIDRIIRAHDRSNLRVSGTLLKGWKIVLAQLPPVSLVRSKGNSIHMSYLHLATYILGGNDCVESVTHDPHPPFHVISGIVLASGNHFPDRLVAFQPCQE